jgi:hypothetical protein
VSRNIFHSRLLRRACDVILVRGDRPAHTLPFLMLWTCSRDAGLLNRAIRCFEMIRMCSRRPPVLHLLPGAFEWLRESAAHSMGIPRISIYSRCGPACAGVDWDHVPLLNFLRIYPAATSMPPASTTRSFSITSGLMMSFLNCSCCNSSRFLNAAPGYVRYWAYCGVFQYS